MRIGNIEVELVYKIGCKHCDHESTSKWSLKWAYLWFTLHVWWNHKDQDFKLFNGLWELWKWEEPKHEILKKLEETDLVDDPDLDDE